MEAGNVFISRKLYITQDFINLFASFSGDFNPIHIDKDFAKKVGLGGTIAHGVIMLQYVVELLEDNFKGGFSFDAKFIKVLHPEETIFAKVVVEKVLGKSVFFKLTVEDEKGETHIAGEGKGEAGEQV